MNGNYRLVPASPLREPRLLNLFFLGTHTIDDTLGKIIYKASVTMSQTKYERVYALSQHLMHVCEEIHSHMRAKRKERENWHKSRAESALPKDKQEEESSS